MKQLYKLYFLIVTLIVILRPYPAKSLQHTDEAGQCHAYFSTEQYLLKIPEPVPNILLKKSKNNNFPQQISENIGTLLARYFNIKKALQNENMLDLQNETDSFIQEIEHFDIPSSPFLGKNILISHLLRIKNSAKKITKSCSPHKSRTNFSEISLLLIDLIKLYQFNSTPLYHQFCPISLDNNKAHWIHNSPEIQNPFHGQKMIHCGVLIEELPSTW